MAGPLALVLRRCALAVSVLHDVDLVPGESGVELAGAPPVLVSWQECNRVLAGTDADSAAGRDRLAEHLIVRRWCADAGADSLVAALRPVGLPSDHTVHPGSDWVCERVLGGALELGLGAVRLDPADPDRVVLVPAAALRELGLDPAVLWAPVRAQLERLGALAAQRVLSDPKGQLRPFGDADALTLLGARSLRTALAAGAGGMAAAVVPMRRRGWTRLALIDPAFGPAAAAATDPPERGFERPLLLTADEVALVREGGHPQSVALLDPAVEPPGMPDVLYR